MARIISIGKFIKEKPLTSLMARTLKAACEKQARNEPFGQADLDGSFMSLVQRSLIKAKTVLHGSEKEVSWFVTEKGMKALAVLDGEAKC
ncbi:MAG: hypothetical protein ABI472_09655 [Ginsengibacter sp.]